MTNERSRAWCFTYNNYTDDDLQRLARLPTGGPVQYICWGIEQASTGTPHLQGYLETTSKRTRRRVSELIGTRAHIEIRRGSQQQAIDYCKKDGHFVEYGTKISQGARTDLAEALEPLRNGDANLQSWAMENPELYCRYRSGIRDIARWSESTAREPPIVIWLWGEPGTGKSKWAHELSTSFWSYGGDGWFDGYDGQEVALFDDYMDDTMEKQHRRITYGLWLKITDRYSLQVPVKGGFVAWKPRIIIFTSNRPIEQLYYIDGLHGAIRRRFRFILRLETLGQSLPTIEDLLNDSS